MTDDLLMLLGAVAGAGVLGWLAGRLVRTDGPPGWPLGDESREAFWRKSLPWPKGVQEDAEIAWHVPPTTPPAQASAATAVRNGDVRPIPPTRPQGRFVSR